MFLVFQAGDVVVGKVQRAQSSQSTEGAGRHRLQPAVGERQPGNTQH